MKFFSRWIIISYSLLVCAFCITACDKTPKVEGKLEVIEQSFQLRQFSDNGWAIDVKGKVKNIGEVDVKKVAVTARCLSCVEVWVPQRWFVATESEDISVSDKKVVVETIGTGEEEYDFDQIDIISYISVGNAEEFHAKEIAYFYTQTAGDDPDPMPNELEVVIKSFETVEKK